MTKKRKLEEIVYDEFASFLPSNSLTEEQHELLEKKQIKDVEMIQFEFLGAGSHRKGTSEPQASLKDNICVQDMSWNETLVSNLEEMLNKEKNVHAFNELLGLLARYVNVLLLPQTVPLYRVAYAAHVLNHIIRLRNLIISNKKRRKELEEEEEELSEETLEGLRDEGFCRPSVLLLCPFRKDAYELVQIFKKLLFGEGGKAEVMNNKRFESEFGDGGYEVNSMRKLNEDLKELKEGNTDDCFRLGVSFAKKSLKLFASFEKADIILCSPIALRISLCEGNTHFLSSLQIVVVDRADILLQQNWEHLPLIMEALHGTPKKIDSDVTRIRQLYLDGYGHHFCQTLLFAKYRHELFNSLMERTSNVRGMITFRPPQEGELGKIELPVCQEIHRIPANNQADQRFKYFKEKILGHLGEHTAIVIPSYYDYVRIRNLLKKEQESFVQCHEYAQPGKVARARDLFFHGEKKVILLTERFHFYFRYRIKGIKRIVFYQPPSCPWFYCELLNMCQPDGRLSCLLVYSPADRIRMQNIFGFQLANSILQSDKTVQVLMSE